MRSKSVERVTLMRIVPRSESWRRNVRASRLTDTTVPSYCRVAAEATPLESARAEMRTTRNVVVVFMAAMLPTTPPTPVQPRAKPRQSLPHAAVAQVGVLVRELLGAAPGAAAADRAVVEVDDLVEERAAVLDREPRCAQPLRAAQRVRIAEAPIHGPGHGAGIRAEVDHAFMIGLQGLCGYRPPVGASRGAIRPAGEAVVWRP